MNHGENTEVVAHPPLRVSPEAAESAAVEGAAGILDDSLLGPALEGEALEEQIRLQVEYFLSRDYLSTDPYLVAQMNSDMYFPITTVATLTTYKVDLEVLVKTLRKSTQLTVNDNGTMVKPNFKIQRNTLILRDIPSSTNVEEVQGIFQGEGCPVVTGIRPDIGECWFVTFTSEEDALKALDFVRGRTFRDAPVKARIKSENLLRSFTYHPPAPAAGDLIRNPPFNYYYPQYPQDHHQDHRRQRGGGGHRQPSGPAAGSRKDYRKYSNGTAGHSPAAPTGSSPAVAGASGSGTAVAVPSVHNTNARGGPQAPTSDSDNRKQRRPSNRNNGGGRKQEGGPLASTTTTPTTNAKPSHGQPPLQLGLAHFPPLSSQSQAKPRQAGYTKDFTKFTKQQLIDIVTTTQVPNQQPASFPTDCLATLAEPNTQLVVSPESNLDRLKASTQEESVPVSASSGQPEAAPSTPSVSTLPTPTTTPAQPTITMASLVATHKSIPAPAPKKPQTQAKAKPSPQPKKEASPTQGKGQQQPNAKKASPPTKKAAAQPRKKAEEGAAQQQQQQQQPSAAQSTAAPASSSPVTAANATTTAAAAAPASAPAASSTAAAPAASPAAPASSPATSGPSTPTYAQQAAKAASKAPAQPKEAKKEAEKKEEKKEEKESVSA